jgi:hypothetical protein
MGKINKQRTALLSKQVHEQSQKASLDHGIFLTKLIPDVFKVQGCKSIFGQSST